MMSKRLKTHEKFASVAGNEVTLTLILCGLFALLGIALHRGRLPAQNLAALALLLFLFAAAAEWIAELVGVLSPGSSPGQPTLWSRSLLWVGMILTCRRISQWFYRGRRSAPYYGYWILGWTVLLTASGWVAIDYLGTGSTILAFASRVCIAAVLLLLVFPWLIVKKPRSASK